MNQESKTTVRTASIVCCLLALAVVVVFAHTTRYDFVSFDDGAYVYENPAIRNGLSAEGIRWALTTTHENQWAPLTWISYLIDYELYGLKPWGYHLTNVALHTATTMLLFLVLRGMTGELWPSAFVAAVFAIHPLNVEAVAWVAERKGLLSGLFFVLTLGAYLRYVRRPASVARYLMVVAFFALGLMCKPMLVTLPFVLLLLDYWPLGRMATERMRRLIGEKIPLLLLTAGACAITPWVQGDAVAWTAALPLSARIGNALVSYVAYLGAWLCPISLAVFYPHRGVELAAWKPFVALLLLSGITAAVLVRWRRNRYLPVGWLWFLGMLVPAIGLVQVGSHAMADRYMYLPQIGLCIAVTWATMAIVRSRPHRAWACGAAATTVLAGLMACAAQQTTYWRDSESLWTRALACTTRNSTAQYNLGVLLAQRGDDGNAMKCFRETLAIQPCSPDAENNLGVLLAKSGQLDNAMRHFRAALRIRPNLADAHRNLGIALQQQGNIADAMVHWREVVRLQPDNVHAVNQLAWAMATGPEASLRNGAEATELAQWAVQLSRGLEPIPLGTLAAAYAEAGRFADAVKAADRAVALATAQNDAVIADALRRQRQFYRTGCAYHESTSQHLP